jgi:hypothetical protein
MKRHRVSTSLLKDNFDKQLYIYIYSIYTIDLYGGNAGTLQVVFNYTMQPSL